MNALNSANISARTNFVLRFLQIASDSCQWCAPRGEFQQRSLPWLFMAAGYRSASMDPLYTHSGTQNTSFSWDSPIVCH